MGRINVIRDPRDAGRIARGIGLANRWGMLSKLRVWCVVGLLAGLLSGCDSSADDERATAGNGPGGGEGAANATTGSETTTGASTGGDGAGGNPQIGALHHGDQVVIDGDFGTEEVIHTFLGGAAGPIESLAEGAEIPSDGGWDFHDYYTTGKVDPERGMVLFNTESQDVYGATRIFDAGEIAENRSFYKAHYVRNVMLLDGQPYTKDYQWKHERVSWQSVWTDTDTEIALFNWLEGNGSANSMTVVRRAASDETVYWDGEAADSNGGWTLLEMIVSTGTLGNTDGLVVTRVHKNGHTVISQNLQPERVYANPDLRLRYFIEQNYFGNFGQNVDGVDNDLPKPQVRELYSDDSRVIVGTSPATGRRRVELRDTSDLQSATLREVQSWTAWNGSITLNLNAGGLPVGTHQLFLVVIDGIDAEGWDNVVASQPVTVVVP
jgi:hypothetical protein